jgi:type IV pilus assembly protein PilO
MDELIAKLSKVPLAQRLVVVLLAVVVMIGGTYFFVVSPKETQIKSLDGKIDRLDEQIVQKKAIARDLTRFRIEVERLKQRLNEALTLLPNEAEIPELLQKLAALVEQSECQMKEFEPQSEINSGFYARIPVKMSVVGNYHAIAVFIDKVSKLSRIVNITDITFAKTKSRNNKVLLEAKFLATTFKFIERKAAPADAGGAKGKAPAKGKVK